MPLDLSSVYAKLERGRFHTKAIKDEVKAFIETKPYRIEKQVSSDFTKYSLILRVNTPPPSERWGLMFGDAIQNFRATLDHLVYAIAIHESKINPPPKWKILAFPLTASYDGKLGFKSQLFRLETLSANIQGAIEENQPYKRLHHELPPILWLLREFNDANKHRVSTLTYAVPAGEGHIGFDMSEAKIPPDQPIPEFHIHSGEIKDGTEFASFTFDRPTPNAKFDKHDIILTNALFHPEGNSGSNRTDFIVILDFVEIEVRDVIAKIAAKVAV